MATITFTVGTSGRTYSTWQTAENALPASAVTAGNSYVVEGYADSTFTAASPLLTISGCTTDATHTLTFKCGPGQSFYDNAGKLTNALRYNTANGVALASNGSGGGPLVIVNNDYVTVDGLQISDVIAGGGLDHTGGSNVVFKNCIVESTQTTSGNGTIRAASATVINCLAVNSGGGTVIVSNGGSAAFRNVTAVQTGAASNFGFRGNYDSPLYVNCVSMGSATAFRSGTSGSSDYNCSDDTTAPGAHSIKSKTFANQFTSTTNDFRVKAGADLINAGTRDQTYTADLDIVKSARSTSTPTIGAWEYASGGGPQTYSYTATGGLTFSGTATVTRSRLKTAAGGIVFSGSANATRGAVKSATGGIVFSGSATQTRGVVRAASGGITFSGSASIIRGLVRAGIGGIVFSGAATVSFFSAVKSYAYTAVGGIVFSGAASVAFQHIGAAISGAVAFFRRRRRE